MEGSQALFSIFGLEVSSVITTMWGIMLVIALMSFFSTRNLDKLPLTRWQNFIEYGIEAILGILAQGMGSEKNARRFFPLLASFFIMILASNLSGLLPGSGHIPGLQAPTSTLSVTAAFAIVVFFATHYLGFREKGWRYFKFLIKPYFFMIPLNLVEQFVRPLSLSLRLFGNIFGDETVVAIFVSIAPIFIPIPMMFLSMMFGLIQAFIFTLLASIYLNEAISEEH